MTVTLVSSAPATAQTAAVDANAATDAPADGGIFASLLLGQLIPATPESLPYATETADSSRTAEGSFLDPAAVLAALTLPTEPGRDAGTGGDRTANLNPALSALSTAAQAGSDVLPAESSIPVAARNAASAESALPTLETGRDKPAKIAATTAFSLPDATLPTTKDRITDDKASPQPVPLALQALNHDSATAKSRETSLAVNTPFRNPGWDADFGQKIMWLTKNDQHSAQLSLNPAQMGPIEISITVDKGNATASFASANADVREAIETALPRLREMFANAGIQLGQTNVGAESFQRQAANDGGGFGGARWIADNAILVGDPTGSGSGRALALQQGNGMVDIFA